MAAPVTYLFALAAPELSGLAALLRSCFEHPWVESYQVGFGPPLVKANPSLVEALKNARSALEKLELYFRHCILDDQERVRLFWLHRANVVRRLGPVEAEEVALKTADALDLTLRLWAPQDAPPAAQASMGAAGLGEIAILDPELRSGRFLIRLDDPRTERLLQVPAIAGVGLPERAALVELRVDPAAVALWRPFVASLAHPSFDLGDPVALARVIQNGERR